MRSGKLLFLMLLLAASGARAEDVIECSGLFGRDTSHAALVAAFGAENVVYKRIDAPQGSTGMATIVFERDRERRLLFEWRDEENRARPIYIGIDGKSKWVAPGGIRIGTPIGEVERQNGRRSGSTASAGISAAPRVSARTTARSEICPAAATSVLPSSRPRKVCRSAGSIAR